MSEHVERVTLDSDDEHGFLLLIETDECEERCRRFDHELCGCVSVRGCVSPDRKYVMAHAYRISLDAGRQLLAALEPLQRWVQEGDREQAAYRAASPEERERVLYGVEPEDAAELTREAADLARKRARESS